MTTIALMSNIISIDTRNTSARAIAQELLDACGASAGMDVRAIVEYLDAEYEIVDHDGQRMSAEVWEERISELVGEPPLTTNR